MNTKLTLSLDKEIIEQAKIYAKGTGRSLSEMVESYFKNLSNPKRKSEDEDDAQKKLNKISGIVKLPPDYNEKEAILDYLEEKHLR